MSITITKFAENKIFNLMNNHGPDTTYLRIGVKGGGCSGLSYVFDFVLNAEDSDRVFDFENIKVCIDKKSYLFLNGMEIDYEETPFKSGIILNNPNAKRTCGCGESFSF